MIDTVKIKQNVLASNLNSSTTNLASGATFTGLAESTLDYAGIQVSLKTDQNCTVYVDQSTDGSNWDINDTFTYYYSNGGASWTVQAVNSYVRVRVKNNGASTTTYFRMQTALCPVVSTEPRAPDSGGEVPVKIHGIEDEYGFEVENTPMGEMRVITPTRLVGSSFEGSTIDPRFWTATIANSATITQSNAQIVLTSGTNTSGSAQLASFRRARYVSGFSQGFRGVVQLGDTGKANNTRKWGVGFGATMPTITDGAYFKLAGTTFSVVTLKGSSESVVSSGSFNGELGATHVVDTNVKTYEIYWTNSKVWFVLGGMTLHTVSANSATWSNTMGHHVYMENVNSGNTSSATLTCRVASIRRLGPLATQPTSFYYSGQTASVILKYGMGNLHGAVVSGVTNNAVISLYDNTAVTATSLLWSSGSMGANTVPFALDFKGLPFYSGLTMAITSANANATVIYE